MSALERQKFSFQNIKTFCINYKKKSHSSITKDYLNSQLTRLALHWMNFENLHKLLEEEFKDRLISYFTEDIYGKTKSLCEAARKDMLTSLRRRTRLKNEPDPAVNIETWFSPTRLELFTLCFEKFPNLWHGHHIENDDVVMALRAPEYLQLLESLEERGAAERQARVACAQGLCREFCRLLRQKLEWAATQSLTGGTGQAEALAMLPDWARRAEGYMKYMPLIFLTTEDELTSKAINAARTRAVQKKAVSRTKPPVPQESISSSSENNKDARPMPALVPLRAPPKPYSAAGRRLMQRVVCGMRHAAKTHGLGRKAAAVVAKEIGNKENEIYALWSSMRVLTKAKIQALLVRGDARTNLVSAHLYCLDWAVADLMMMYEYSPVREESFQEYKQKLALLTTFHLVQRFGLEVASQNVSAQKWHEAARWYCKTGVVMSPVGLQRRWYEMKLDTRYKLRAHLCGVKCMAIQPLHRAIANRYPHVVTGDIKTWDELLAAGLVARPTNERGGSKKRASTAENVESTEKDNSAVTEDLETIVLTDETVEASDQKNPVPSARPGPSKSMTIVDMSPTQATSGVEIPSECTSKEDSKHVQTNEVISRRYGNTTVEGDEKNKTASSAECGYSKRRIKINDINELILATDIVKDEDDEVNIDGDKEIIDSNVPKAESDELKRLQALDEGNAFDMDTEVSNIRTEAVEEEDDKMSIDVNKEIIELDASSAKPDKFKSNQETDNRNACNITKEVVESKMKSNTNKVPGNYNFATEVIRAIEKELFSGFDTTSTRRRPEKNSRKCTGKKNTNNVQTNKLKNTHRTTTLGKIHKNNVDVNKATPKKDALSVESQELKGRKNLDEINILNKIKRAVEGRWPSKTNTTQFIHEIEKDIFTSSKENNGDSSEKVTSSCQINSDDSNSNVSYPTKKHPMLTQMLQTVCIFDDDAEFNAFLTNNEVSRKDSSNAGVTTNTNVCKNETKSLFSSTNRKRARISDNWAQEIVGAIKKQRLESTKLENSPIYNLFNEELSNGNKKSGLYNIIKKALLMMGPGDSEASQSTINLDSGDEEDNSQDSEVVENIIDPKLLMYPVVVMMRFENDPALRIVSKPQPLPTCRSPSPTASNIESESLSLSDVKLEKIDAHLPFIANTPSLENLNEKSRVLLKLCKPCEVILEKLDEVDKSMGRLAKKVELQDIDEVRRNNRKVLTAQVAPLALDPESSSTDSCDSDWAPVTQDSKTAKKASKTAKKSSSSTESSVDDNINSDSETTKKAKTPATAKEPKTAEENLKQLLNDFNAVPVDGKCCELSKNTRIRGTVHTTASLAMERGCSRCLWRLLSLPPTNAGEAALQRRLLRHSVVQAASTAPTVSGDPNLKPSGTRIPRKRQKKFTRRPCSDKWLPIPVVSSSCFDVPPNEQSQPVPSAVASPSAAESQPDQIDAGKTCLETTKPAGPSTLKKPQKDSAHRVSAPTFRPEFCPVVKEKPIKNNKRAKAKFKPIITSVLSLAPPQADKVHEKSPLNPEIIKLIQSKITPSTQGVTERPPLSNARQTDAAATTLNVPKTSNKVAISSNSTQMVIRQPVVQNQSTKRPELEKAPRQSITVSNALQPKMQDVAPQNWLSTCQLPPIPIAGGQTGSQNSAAQGIANTILQSTLAGNAMQPPGLQNAPWNYESVVTQEPSAFQSVLHMNSNQPNPIYPTPINITQSNQFNPLCTQPNQPNQMYIQPNLSNPMLVNQNQPNQRNCALEPSAFQRVLSANSDQMNPININTMQIAQPNQLNPMFAQTNQQNSMYIQPNQPNPMYNQPNHFNSMFIQPNQLNSMWAQSNQQNSMYIQPNQSNPMFINQNQPNPMLINQNQPNSMIINQNQSNSIIINQNHPNPMFMNQNQPIPMYIQSNQPNMMYRNQMQINANQSNPIYPNEMYLNSNQQNSMYLNQNQLNLINSTQNQPTSSSNLIAIKEEESDPSSSYLPSLSHPNPYDTSPEYSSALLQHSTAPSVQTNMINQINADSLHSFVNSMQSASQSPLRPPPPYEEAVSYINATVDVKIGYCFTGYEMRNKRNSFTRLHWRKAPVIPSHEWVLGRESSSLEVLCTPAYGNPWAVLGKFLVLSSEEAPPPNFDVWGLKPRMRLRLPHGKDYSSADDVINSPAQSCRLKVRAFASAGAAGGAGGAGAAGGAGGAGGAQDAGAPPRSTSCVKLADHPTAVYAKLLVALGNANACRMLLKRGGTIQFYCTETCELIPVRAKLLELSASDYNSVPAKHYTRTGAECEFSLSSPAPLLPALRDLARQLQDSGDAPPQR